MGATKFIASFFMAIAFAQATTLPTLKPHKSTTFITENPPSSFITLEEHYVPKSIRAYETNPVYELLIDAEGDSIVTLLENINGSRIDSMNANCIRIQVVSNGPNPQALDKPGIVQEANDDLAKAIAPYPDRFRGFCFLPMAYPQLAAQELERCVLQLKFVGALVDDHLLNNTFYDGPEYEALWSAFEKLDVPIYLHPTYPPISAVNASGGLYTPIQNSFTLNTASVLATAGWGWHSDAGMQFLRLWLAGTFDKHPNLKIILGHMGEMLPYMLARADLTLGWVKSAGVTIPEAYANNIWVTTSGFFSLDPFTTLLRTTAMDRIMYSVDYPWSKNELGTAFMTALKSSDLVSDQDWEKIAFRNAQKLLRIE